jgi:hypothetical protein
VRIAVKKCLLISLIAMLLPACLVQTSGVGDALYKKSRNGPKLVVPPPRTAEEISHFYDIPAPRAIPEVTIQPPVD